MDEAIHLPLPTVDLKFKTALSSKPTANKQNKINKTLDILVYMFSLSFIAVSNEQKQQYSILSVMKK